MSMNVKSCKRCKRLFNYMNNLLCPACVQEIDEMFIKVRKYLEEKPNASMVVLVEDTGVPEKDIIAFLKEGRLSFAPGGAGIKCEKCGRQIQSGRMCDHCKAELSNVLSGNLARSQKAAMQETAEKDKKSKGTGLHAILKED